MCVNAFYTRILIAFASFLFMAPAIAEMAPANTLIGNQASISFTDAEGNRRSVDSNRVDIEVLPVYALSISADGTLEGAANGSVRFPHVIENRGNDDDSFAISLADLVGDDFDFTNLRVFLDDGSGNLGAEITGPVTIARNASINVIVVADIPAGQADGSQGQLLVTATSSNDAEANDSNTDTAIVTDDAIIRVTKAFSASSADPSTTATVTLTIENLSTTASGEVELTDVLANELVYQAASGLWSESGTALNDDSGDNDPAGIDYAVSGQTVSITLDAVAGNATQTVSFDVAIADDAPAGPVTNKVSYRYGDGGGTTVGPAESNQVEINVNQIANVVFSDASADGSVSSNTDEDGQQNDVITINAAGQGATILFADIVTNTGNGGDTFNIDFDASGFPAGSIVRLLQADAATPLIDTNNDGLPDTGALAAGVNYSVYLQVTLPAGASGDNGGNGWVLTSTATSSFNVAVANATSNVLGTINGATVDLTVNRSTDDGADASNGVGQGPEANAVVTVGAESGDAAIFNLYLNNTDGSDDNYNLLENNLPSGWTVTYYADSNGNGVFDAGDQPLAGGKTGVIAAGGELLVFAEVGVPADTDPGSNAFSFIANSAATGARDELSVAVDVAATRDVTVSPPDQSGTVFPGGAETYSVQLTNDGNVAEQVELAISNSAAGWGTTVYIDVDGDGRVSPGDTVIDPNNPIELAPGQTLDLLVEVNAPAGSEQGDENVTTVGGTFNSGNATIEPATLTTTVSSGSAELDKQQAADTDCDGSADSAFTDAQIDLQPGQCAIYQIVASAVDTDLNDVVISDSIPQYTSYFACGGGCAASASPGTVTSEPAEGERGSVQAEITTLANGTQMTLTFSVQLDDER